LNDKFTFLFLLLYFFVALLLLFALVWLLMVTTKELGTYQPVDVLSMGDGVLGALVVTG
jgi:nitrogen fixation/metabolism regulation signal transduction histidine kinase